MENNNLIINTEKTAADCPHFGACGGCTFRDIPYEEELRQKEEQVKKLLAPYLDPDTVWEGILPSPLADGYRNKMEFSFGDEYKDGPLALGMHKKGSFYDIVTVDHCRITPADYNRILRFVLDYFTERGVAFYQKKRGTGTLRHLVVRKAAKTGEILVMLVTTSAYTCEPDFAEGLLTLPLDGKIVGILHALNDLPADTVQAQELKTLYGADCFYEELLGLRFQITPFSFFQTNSLGAERLYSVVRDYAGDGSGLRIFDLYSGTGTIAQLLAPVAAEVTGVEIVEEAVEAARKNAAANGLTNCSFIAGDVFKVLSGLERQPDRIVLDPPREGMTPKALRKIISYGVEQIVYVSCKPTSLARDMEALYEAGYRIRRGCVVDMFPRTKNQEVVCCLHRQKKDFITVPDEPKNVE